MAPISTTVPYTGYTSSDKPATVTTTFPDSPTTPAPVPTSAPKVTPVVSSSTSADSFNKTIIPTMKSAQSALDTYLKNKNATTISKKTNADGTSELFLSDGSRLKTDASGNPISPTTPEQQIADTADAGMKFAYSSDGTRTQIPISESATTYGMFDTNPTVAPTKPVLETVELPSGTSVKQFNDGTYGMFDVNGKYIGAGTATQFKNAQNGQDVLDKLNSAINGNYPLSASQQAQIDSVKALYANLVKEQEKYNANYTGGTTVAQNLYGIGNTMMGQGAIKGVIDEGIAKVADIQSKMASDVAKMTAAFQSQNLQDLKDAYASYANNAKSLQDNLDRIHSEATTIARDEKQQRATAELAIDNDIRQLMSYARGIATPEQLQNAQIALQNHDMEAAMTALGDSTRERSPAGKEYDDYVAKAKAAGVVPMGWNEYQTADANRKARIAAAGVANGYSMQTMSKVIQIADDFKNEPSVKSYQVIAEGKQFMDNIANDTTNPADQQGIIYAFAKIMDPNSVVREGEYNTVQKYAQSWANTFGFKADRIFSNAPFLTPEAIKNMKATVESRVNASKQSYDNIYKQKVDTINKITGGKDGSDYITDYSKGYGTIGDEHINQSKDNPLNLNLPKTGSTSSNNQLGI